MIDYKLNYYKCWLVHLLEDYELYITEVSSSVKGELVHCLKSCLQLCLNYEGDNSFVSELVYLFFYNLNKIDDAFADDPRYKKLLLLYSDVVLLSNGSKEVKSIIL
jgi:hypothetical protein